MFWESAFGRVLGFFLYLPTFVVGGFLIDWITYMLLDLIASGESPWLYLIVAALLGLIPGILYVAGMGWMFLVVYTCGVMCPFPRFGIITGMTALILWRIVMLVSALANRENYSSAMLVCTAALIFFNTFGAVTGSVSAWGSAAEAKENRELGL